MWKTGRAAHSSVIESGVPVRVWVSAQQGLGLELVSRRWLSGSARGFRKSVLLEHAGSIAGAVLMR